MKVFENTPVTKKKFLFHLKEHKRRDSFLQGQYSGFSKGIFRGCAVGCSIRSIAKTLGEGLDFEDHSLYEKYLGVPEWVAVVEDGIFEGISKKRAKTFPVEFGEALNEGSDLNSIKTPFIIYLMEDSLKTLESISVDKEEYKKVFDCVENAKQVVKRTIKVLGSGDSSKIKKVVDAASAVESEAWSVVKEMHEVSEETKELTAFVVAELVSLVANLAGPDAKSMKWLIKTSMWTVASIIPEKLNKSVAISESKFEKYADKFLELIRECK